MKTLFYILLAMMLILPMAYAVDFNQQISSSDKATFDQILEPVMKVYNFIKYAATAIAVIFMVFAAITFLTNGRDQAKREQAKQTITYIIIGLAIIWVAPLVVQYLTQ